MKARELDQLEAAYTIDLLARLTESIDLTKRMIAGMV